MNAIWGLIRREPARSWAVISAAYAVAQMLYNLSQHAGVLDPQVIVALVSAVAALGVRTVVTPTVAPKGKDPSGVLVPLVPLNATPQAGNGGGERLAPPGMIP